MPPPLDLAGRRFGKLKVIARTEGKTKGGYWLCRCDCGKEEIIPSWRLPYSEYITRNRSDSLEACTNCAYTIPCGKCGKPFLSEKASRYCSEECRNGARRESGVRCYHQTRKVKHPDINRMRHQRILKKLANDPQALHNYKQQQTEYSKKKRERINSNPEIKEKINRRARERYIAKAEQTQSKRRQRQSERLAAMTQEERDAWNANRRQKNTQWRRLQMETMRQLQPEKYRQYLDRFNEYKRHIWRRDRAFAELNAIASELEKRTNK